MSSRLEILPHAILSNVFSELLLLEDICLFDSAICNKERRHVYLDCIGSESCIWLGDKHRALSSDAISWLRNRSIKIRHLRCNQISNDTAVKISGSGTSLHWLSIKMGSIIDLIQIMEGCPNLDTLDLEGCDDHLYSGRCRDDTCIINEAEKYPNLRSLSLRFCRYITDIHLIKVAGGCVNLQSLVVSDCRNVTDTGIISLVEKCHNLLSLDLRSRGLNTEYSDISIMKLSEGFPDLQSLYLDNCIFIHDESVITFAGFRNLHTLSLGSFSRINDMSIVMVIDACLNLQNLNLANCRYLTDTSIIKIADNCPNLLSLDLHNITCQNEGNNSNITDVSMFRLAEGCSKCD